MLTAISLYVVYCFCIGWVVLKLVEAEYVATNNKMTAYPCLLYWHRFFTL